MGQSCACISDKQSDGNSEFVIARNGAPEEVEEVEMGEKLPSQPRKRDIKLQTIKDVKHEEIASLRKVLLKKK